MKKFTLFLTALCLTSQVSGSGSCTESERFTEFGLNGHSKPHFKTSTDDTLRILKISAAELNICDDSIVKAIKYPRPLSVSEALESIQTEFLQPPAMGKLIDIDLSSNTICDEGAALVAGCFYNKAVIKALNLSWNRITDDGIASLINVLKPLLIQPEFTSLDIKGNYGANAANLRKILASFDQTQQDAVRRKIQI
jgi:hypothetical protein